MSAALAIDPFIEELEEPLISSIAPNKVLYLNNSKKVLAANSLMRARHLYVVRSLAAPQQLIPNSELALIRKLGWLLILFQIIDGLFTVCGIKVFGGGIEGNPLVKQIIEACGPGFGIALVKLSTILIIVSICVFGCRVKWLTKALSGVAGVYFLFALLPWSYILGSYFLGY